MHRLQLHPLAQCRYHMQRTARCRTSSHNSQLVPKVMPPLRLPWRSRISSLLLMQLQQTHTKVLHSSSQNAASKRHSKLLGQPTFSQNRTGSLQMHGQMLVRQKATVVGYTRSD